MCPSGKTRYTYGKNAGFLISSTNGMHIQNRFNFLKSPTPPGGSPRNASIFFIPRCFVSLIMAIGLVLCRTYAGKVSHSDKVVCFYLYIAYQSKRLSSRASASAISNGTKIGSCSF
jgi:hypothetical protein